MFLTNQTAMDTFRQIVEESKVMVDMFHTRANTPERTRIATMMSLLLTCSEILYEDMNRFRAEFEETNFKNVHEQLSGEDAEILVAKLLVLLEYSNDFDNYVKHTNGTKGEGESVTLASPSSEATAE